MSAVPAIFERGVFRPIRPVALAEGARVNVIIPDLTDEMQTNAPGPAGASQPRPTRPPMFGSAKGLFVMSPDFDEPLDDFSEYPSCEPMR